MSWNTEQSLIAPGCRRVETASGSRVDFLDSAGIKLMAFLFESDNDGHDQAKEEEQN